MMLFKLSLRNLKKSMKDYMIYFATLILGVAVFYVFNALEKQTVMLKVGSSTNEIIELMNNMLSAISVFVAFVLGFLIVYASNFLMKRRKKEFGIYMILGMSKKNISSIILVETLIIGIISLVSGLVLGIVVSQGMSIVVANLFEADMTKFAFVISKNAIGKTILYFCIMYVVVLIMDTIVVGKTKLIKLINAGRVREKNVARNPVLCILVFVFAAVVLGSAYYNVTAGRDNITSEAALLMQIFKGVISTLMIFCSISGILIFFSKRCKKFYYRGLNSFTIKELGSRINTTVFSGSIICLMLFITICVLSSAMSVRKAMNDNLKSMVPVDINLYMTGGGDYTLQEILQKANVDMSMFQDEIYLESYKGNLTLYDMAKDYIEQMEITDSMKEAYKENQEEIVRISDYNRVAKAYGLRQYSLKDDEYIVVADYKGMVELRNEALKDKPVIQLGTKQYRPKYEECKDGFLLMSGNHINFGIILVPDDADLSEYKVCQYYMMANYNADSEEDAEKIESYIVSKKFGNILNSASGNEEQQPEVDGITKISLYESSIGMSAMMVFIGIYLGLIFMVSGAAILALKELSEAVDNKEKYDILRKIGVDRRDISKSLFAQCAMFFGFPLLLAVVHSVFGIQVCMYILETMGTTGLIYSIVTTAIMIGAIYGVYFLITYYCSKKIVEQ